MSWTTYSSSSTPEVVNFVDRLPWIVILFDDAGHRTYMHGRTDASV
jgi:hypothetical protein